MHYYKIGREGKEIVLNTQINYRDIVQMGNILGIKIGNRIYYRDNIRFWCKDVNTNCDTSFDVLDNIVTSEAVGFFDDYIAVEDKSNCNPNLFICKFYDYSGNEISRDSSLYVYAQARKIMLDLLIDWNKYSDYYDAMGTKWYDRPPFGETFIDTYEKTKINYEYIIELISLINSKDMIKDKAAELLMEYSEIFLLYGYDDFSVPFLNTMSLIGIPLNIYQTILNEKNPLCDKTLYERIRRIVDEYDESLVADAFLDFNKLRVLYNNICLN